MAYRLEGKDIVISGFEQGIADNPYNGVADMRNMEIIAVPGEASVGLATSAVVKPAVANAVSFTASASTDRLTVSSTSGWYENMAIVLNTNSSTGPSTGVVYYVRNISGATFQISTAFANTVVNITVDGSGTLTSYQYPTGGPIAYFNDVNGNFAGSNATWITDTNAHVWFILSEAVSTIPANTLLFAGNIGGIAATGFASTNGLAVWNGYLFLFGIVTVGTDLLDIGDLITTASASAWTYTWKNADTASINGRIETLVSQEDGNLYWISSDGLGSLIETPGDSFDPTDAASYTFNNGDALLIPENDQSTCIAELGGVLLIGGRLAFVYVWNKVDPGFSSLLNIPEAFTTKIVATSQNAYVFAGVRGRIYITNGSGIDLYKKVPDYVTALINPFFFWQDASFGRNQLYFGFTVYNSAGTVQSICNGVWAIDLDSDALRLLNKTSDSAYAGTLRMVIPRPTSSPSSRIGGFKGNNLIIGWYDSNGSYLDVSSSDPYTNYESYLETEIVPVGTYLDPFTPSQLEWKTSAPLVSGEAVRISYRTNITEAYTVMGTSTTAGVVSDLYQANFQKVQWAQFKVETKSTASTPSYTRVTELRIRDWPSGVKNRG